MSPDRFFEYAGIAASIIGAMVMTRASWQMNTARIWKGEAEAQKQRADRLQADMDEIKIRLSRLEAENRHLIELLTALDPVQLATRQI